LYNSVFFKFPVTAPGDEWDDMGKDVMELEEGMGMKCDPKILDVELVLIV
jgi:hypothetical protein